ncbi:MAG: 3-phosphoshikimate 1-carboxyvinyltransferase [Synergistaceae bacterium]|jgi:3-phosphoshikimate 1-carboxyvinyltransferase|nr:3-phosphoshikimate 1-carboxyvinyltransferase [Synergistaceae bacterium]
MNDERTITLFPRGVVTPPPSKSLSHRAAICSALAGGVDRIENLGGSEDIDATIAGISALGLTERGLGPKCRTDRVRVVDCNESGSTLRFLMPAAALDDAPALFKGRGRLLDRPLDAYAGIFAAAGATFRRERDGILVRGPLRGGSYSLPGDVSSQFISGLLFALPLLAEDSEIRVLTPLESSGYVDMTVDVMRRFGVTVVADGSVYHVRGRQRYRHASYRVEADYSQAAFFLAASALGCDVGVAGLNPHSIQGDRAILSILREMGADVVWSGNDNDGRVVSVRAGGMLPVTVDARETPDLVPPVAVLCCFCGGTSGIVNAGRLRLKESDRLRALAAELGRLGADVRETDDSLSISGADRLRGGRVDAWGDHRIAMAMAVAAIRCEEPVRLTGWESVNKSYPGFWRDFEGERSS